MLKGILIMLLQVYRWVISPMKNALGIGPSCRYVPTCSNYTLEAIMVYGAWKGGWMGFKRLMRCHPWASYGYDPVPLPMESWDEVLSGKLKETQLPAEGESVRDRT